MASRSSKKELLALLAAAQAVVQQRASKKKPKGKSKPAEDKDPISLTDEEVIKVLTLAAARRLRDQVLFCITFWHGLRASEAIDIRRRDLQKGIVRVRRLKGSRSGQQPLLNHPNPLLCERDLVNRWLAEMDDRGKKGAAQPGGRRSRDKTLLSNQNDKPCHNPGDDRLFPLSRQRFYQLFREYASAAGLPPEKQHPHCLKHSIATWMLQQGIPVNQVRDRLGWKSMRTADYYTRVTQAQVGRNIEAKADRSPAFQQIPQGSLFPAD